MHTAPSESRFRITGKHLEEQEKMYIFLSEQEKDKNGPVATSEMIALLFFCQYNAGLKLFV